MRSITQRHEDMNAVVAENVIEGLQYTIAELALLERVAQMEISHEQATDCFMLELDSLREEYPQYFLGKLAGDGTTANPEWNKYIYENGIFKNKLGINGAEMLAKAERELTALRMDLLRETPVDGAFDYNHFKEIHRLIFDELYDWAGKERTIDLSRNGALFSRVGFIERSSEKLFEELRAEQYLRDLSKEDFACRAAYYWGEINIIHSFCRGNGRTQREFLRELALKAGYKLDFSTVSPKSLLTATTKSSLGDNKALEEVIRKNLKVGTFETE